MKWEYKTIKLRAAGLLGGKVDEAKLDTMMNEMGAAEWELVSAFDTNEGYGNTKDVIVIFKRPRER